MHISDIGGEPAKGNQRLSRGVEHTKVYLSQLRGVCLQFLGPMVMLIGVAMALDVHDKERFGLGWMQWVKEKDDKVREEKYPAYEPSSLVQKRRADAASMVDYITPAESSA